MDRRSFLSSIFMGLAGIVGGGFGVCASAPGAEQNLLPGNSLFSDQSSAAKIGRCVLSGRVDTESTALDLDAAWRHRIFRRGQQDAQPDTDAVRQNIRDDYANGRTVCVEGWVLSVTEVQLCVSVALN